MTAPRDRLRALITRRGPVPWSVFVETALYGEGGFYLSGGGAGRARDFLTSPELGPVFGAVVARAIDATWEACGRPDPWVVVEGGAGSGALAAAVLAARPACAAALRYVAVEVSPVLRAASASRLPLEDPAQILGPRLAPAPGEESDPAVHRAGVGPLVASMAELPAVTFSGVVFANELLDNLPFDVYARDPGGWSEVRVGVDDAGFVELLVPAAEEVAAHLDALAPDSPVGGRVPWQTAASSWIREALALVERGRVVVVDYARTTASLAAVAPDAWMRTYRRGGPGSAALAAVGEQDITADVALDQLALVRSPDRVLDQAAWLAAHGLGEIEADAARRWREGAAAGGLAALAARSAVSEAAALRDPSGLGGFTVVEWDVMP
jgi:SAM-dependent MidA family methyltransferase